jgi:hypothetical protein
MLDTGRLHGRMGTRLSLRSAASESAASSPTETWPTATDSTHAQRVSLSLSEVDFGACASATLVQMAVGNQSSVTLRVHVQCHATVLTCTDVELLPPLSPNSPDHVPADTASASKHTGAGCFPGASELRPCTAPALDIVDNDERVLVAIRPYTSYVPRATTAQGTSTASRQDSQQSGSNNRERTPAHAALSRSGKLSVNVQGALGSLVKNLSPSTQPQQAAESSTDQTTGSPRGANGDDVALLNEREWDLQRGFVLHMLPGERRLLCLEFLPPRMSAEGVAFSGSLYVGIELSDLEVADKGSSGRVETVTLPWRATGIYTPRHHSRSLHTIPRLTCLLPPSVDFPICVRTASFHMSCQDLLKAAASRSSAFFLFSWSPRINHYQAINTGM